uniref:HP domain-containing protein n=1 Tax=Periophthalmus magnuspinnatus TaxID=409849 RepID=A0A3B3ZK43_9GOBI
RLFLQPTVQTSPGSVLSLRPTAPGSPLTITARVDGGVIGYKDLAALPRDKAILEIERPDLMLYQPHYCYSPIEVSVTSSLSPYSVSPPPSPEVTSSSPPQLKHMEDLIIESSKFPSAQAPDPNQPSAIETESWPCPPSTAVIGLYLSDSEQESRRRAAVGFNHNYVIFLFQIQGNLGKILLKDEKGSAPMRRKKTRSLPERTTGLSANQTQLLKNGDRGASLPSMLHYKVFPYSTLVVTHRGRSTLPPEVDRTQLERHLSEDEFYSVFRMTLEEFDQLSLWKRNELKKRVCLF